MEKADLSPSNHFEKKIAEKKSIATKKHENKKIMTLRAERDQR